MDTSQELPTFSKSYAPATLPFDADTPPQLDIIYSQPVDTVSSPPNVTTSCIETRPNLDDSINNENITESHHGLCDNHIPGNQEVMSNDNLLIDNFSPTINDVDIARKGNENCDVKTKSTSKSLKKIKNIKNRKNKISDNKEFRELKQKLKENQAKLAEALKSIKSYRNLFIKKQQELEKWQHLNSEMQIKIYEKLDEYASRDINPFERIAATKADVGYLRKSDNTIHGGNNIYISKNLYDTAKNKLYTYRKKEKKGSVHSGFVRYIAESIFGYETLKNSSVTGKKNRRTNTAAKPKLDPDKLAAVIGIFKYYLEFEIKLDPVAVAQELNGVGEIIASKIADMNRVNKKKQEAEEKDQETEQLHTSLLINSHELSNSCDVTVSKENESSGSSLENDTDDNSDTDNDENNGATNSTSTEDE